MAIVWVCGGGGWEDDGGNEEDVEGSVGGRLWEGVWGGGRVCITDLTYVTT